MSIYKEPYQKFPKLSDKELRGTEGIEVELISWTNDPYYTIYMGQKASWRPWDTKRENVNRSEVLEMLKGLAEGKVWAGQAFEGVAFTFAIKNISRACTHQLVRTRIGAGFMQESGREGTWNEAPFVTPLTILEHEELHKDYAAKMEVLYEDYGRARMEYPPQDIRFWMPHGVAQNMWVTYNFRALMELLNKRLCCTMQWEINTLARMMRDEVIRKFPHLGILLKSSCERSGGCKSITPYYQPGMENNGNKVYFPLEGNLCGKASDLTEGDKAKLLEEELESPSLTF